MQYSPIIFFLRGSQACSLIFVRASEARGILSFSRIPDSQAYHSFLSEARVGANPTFRLNEAPPVSVRTCYECLHCIVFAPRDSDSSHTQTTWTSAISSIFSFSFSFFERSSPRLPHDIDPVYRPGYSRLGRHSD
jgi:hypothetical protein